MLNACNTNSSYVYNPPSGHGGVIIADAAGDFAMGIYGTLNSPGGQLAAKQAFSLFDFRTCASTTKWNAVYAGSLQQGQNVFTTYVATGTLASVAAAMSSLYTSGYY